MTLRESSGISYFIHCDCCTLKFSIVHVYQLTHRLCLCQYNYITAVCCSAVNIHASGHLSFFFLDSNLKSRTLTVYFVILIFVYEYRCQNGVKIQITIPKTAKLSSRTSYCVNVYSDTI